MSSSRLNLMKGGFSLIMTKDMCDLGVSWGTASHPELHLYLVSAVAAPPSLSIPLFSTRQSLTTRIHRKRRYGTALRRPAQKQLVYLTIFFTCCLVHDTRVNHQVYLSKHVCPNPSQLLMSELIREMYYRFNCQRERWTLPFLHTRRSPPWQ